MRTACPLPRGQLSLMMQVAVTGDPKATTVLGVWISAHGNLSLSNGEEKHFRQLRRLSVSQKHRWEQFEFFHIYRMRTSTYLLEPGSIGFGKLYIPIYHFFIIALALQFILTHLWD